jgi:ribosome maturation factor RimP
MSPAEGRSRRLARWHGTVADQDEQGLSGAHGTVQGKGHRKAVQHDSAAPAVATAARIGWREAILATVQGLGFELVDVERAQRGLLRIFIDRIPGRTYSVAGEFITVDDCEQVTRQLQYALEVENLEYARLEVSSPGLDRPLKTEADFERFAGQAVHVVLKAPFQGRKTWQGVLNRSEDGAAWSLQFKDGKAEQVLSFKFEEAREARLVPVVDFKGRKSKDGGSAGAAHDAAPQQDGG